MVVEELITHLGFSTDEKPLEKVNHLLEGVHRRLEFLGAAEVVKGLFELAERFSSVGEGLESAALSAGVTVESFQKLAFAASQNAVSQEELSGAMGKLTRNISEARDGSENATKAFMQLGITPDQVKGFHSSAEALAAISDRLKTVEDPIKRQALAMELLGRGSYNMTKFLGAGSQAWGQLGKEAEDVGAVLSGQQVETLATLEDTLSQLFLTVKNVAASLGAAFAPAIIEASHAIMKLWAANRQLITVNLVDWIHKLEYALGFVFEAILETTTSVLEFAKAHPILVRNVLAVVGALMGLELVVGGFLGIFGKIAGMFTNTVGVMRIFTGVGGGIFTGILKGAGALQGVLVWILEHFGLLIVRTFPALGEAIFALGGVIAATPVGWFLGIIVGITGAIAALVLGVQAAWAVFHDGKAFKDTWLGQAYDAIKSFGKKGMKLLGFGGDEPAAGVTGSTINTDGTPSLLSAPNQGATDFFQNGAEKMASLSQMPSAMPPMVTQALTGGNSVTNGGDAHYEVNAPVTLNITGNADSQMADKVGAAVSQHVDRMLRQTQRSLAPAAAH